MSVDFYQILESIIQSNLAANAINTELAVGIAEHVITELAERFGGQAVYLKKQHAIYDSLKNTGRFLPTLTAAITPKFIASTRLVQFG